MTGFQAQWPSVHPEVVAEVVSALSPRLQKRLDGAAAKLADRPVTRTGDEWRVEIDEEAALLLHAPGGVVRTADDVRCGCLLAPACLHRAAFVSAAVVAEATCSDAPSAEAQERDVPPPAPLTPGEADAIACLRRCAAAALAAGVSGAGGVLQAELLRTAHQARLLGLYRPAALAVTVVSQLRAARAAEPDHRLADLSTSYRDLLDVATALLGTGTPGDELRGVPRQTYRDVGGLRLYGLFAEPIVSATHAGAMVWVVDGDGRLATVSDVTPHAAPAEAAGLAQAAAGRPVRLGDATLSHRELARAGLVVQGATRTVSGRLGAGSGVRAVRAAGAGWHEPPVAGLWEEPVAAQVERALTAERTPYELRPAGSDLLFLDVTVLGPGRVPGSPGPQLLADCAGLTVALLPAGDDPQLAFGANLALLASEPGLRLRVVGRLERAAHPRLRLLAAGVVPGEATLGLPAERQGRISLGLERLQRADLPPDLLSEPAECSPAASPVVSPGLRATQPPVHLLTRRLEQVVTSGRRSLAAGFGQSATEDRQLRAAGLGTAAQLLAALRAAAAEQDRDVFGRLRTDDQLAFARGWLAAACYQEELATALCSAGWLGATVN
ncbi:hypothetical protein [Kitasatospora sp. MAP5-34]|uniref:hypothetical protein n=1 Tax=Kitasatospora sp. MAP5-34 TaxID=3035102 RepID=UPI0024751FAF|nr:hypothetical protein [Kitasatospora sp. MAP5-34]MDH6580372.1 hypothetical protein [Kitasatospora sp. MAP5-34]